MGPITMDTTSEPMYCKECGQEMRAVRSGPSWKDIYVAGHSTTCPYYEEERKHQEKTSSN